MGEMGIMGLYGADGEVNPTSGTTAGGTACTLTGANLMGCTAVSFGGTAGTGISVAEQHAGALHERPCLTVRVGFV